MISVHSGTIFVILLHVIHNVVCGYTGQHSDYVAPVNPCRPADRLCSTRCTVMQMKGDLDCHFCVCKDKSYYVKWETIPASTLSPLPTTTLPPGVIIVNNIKYIEVGDPCEVTRDTMCPALCARIPSTNQYGRQCTKCDCRGHSVFLGR